MSDDVSIGLICPTIGRSTLKALYDSVIPQLSSRDYFIVIGDGPQPSAKELLPDLLYQNPGKHLWYEELPERVGDYGCTPCMRGIAMANTDLVFFIGDDDLLAEGAFEAIRKGAKEHPHVPLLFRMLHSGRVLGHTLECSSVSGQQIVVPNDKAKMPNMADCPPHQIRVSDWVFIQKVNEAWGNQTVFLDDIIAILPRQNDGRVF